MLCAVCGLDELTKRFPLIRESPANTTSLPSISEQVSSVYEVNTVGAILLCSLVLMIFYKKYLDIREKQFLYSLSRSKLVGLESSSSWGVLLPNKNGRIPVSLDDFMNNVVEVIVPSLKPHKKLELTKEKWMLSRLTILRADSPIGKIQTDVAVVVQQKLKLQADLEEQIIHAQKVKDMYEFIKSFESDLGIVQTYKNIYLRNLRLVSKLKTSQTLQDEHIKELLLFLEIIKFDKKNNAINISKHQKMTTEIKERYLETLDWVQEYLKLGT